MLADDAVFAGSIPEVYGRLMVPMLFEPYARDLAIRVAEGAQEGMLEAVLETAAGTGALTRALASQLPKRSRIEATDLNPAMIERAVAAGPADLRIRWSRADALDLPFEDERFDAVACQFGAMFFPDKARGYAEAFRVLRPGERFLFSLWDRVSENAFVAVVSEALARLFPDDPPSFMARIPHGHHDTGRAQADLAAAGFRTSDVATVAMTATAASPLDAATAFCQGTPLRAEIEARAPLRLEEATQAAAAALEAAFGSGPISGPVKAFVLSAVR